MALPTSNGITRKNMYLLTSLGLWWGPTPWYYYHEFVVGGKQAKPVDRVLAYHRRNASGKYSGNDTTYYSGVSGVADYYPESLSGALDSYVALARNKAYEKLKEKLITSAQIGASLGEYRQAHEMIYSRAAQLLNGARALRRLDFPGVAKAFSIRLPKGTNFRNLKSFGNLWLEFHFGWEPLVKDIFDAVEVCTKPAKVEWAKASSVEEFSLNQNFGSPVFRRHQIKGKFFSLMGAGITVSNPNLAFASNLGILNPLSIAWELVPFSFVVDWYANVGQILGSMSDFYGYDLSDPFHTDTFKYRVDYNDFGNLNAGYYANVIVDVTAMDRQSGLVSPTFVTKPARLPSLNRAATQIGLLTQFLSGHR